ncbi:hypothetical protein L596_010858 [Steinernema carpocapsae]|uniref:Uncharacterized protein n=1 Tax=Steinernema carpocapsae TaxID=34508 RepID=A0A4U5PJT2_STECR|nr:hypothetical protein L596_010858 [Steinernema carpocapsae]
MHFSRRGASEELTGSSVRVLWWALGDLVLLRPPTAVRTSSTLCRRVVQALCVLLVGRPSPAVVWLRTSARPLQDACCFLRAAALPSCTVD